LSEDEDVVLSQYMESVDISLGSSVYNAEAAIGDVRLA
jgi:hypothetical protein